MSESKVLAARLFGTLLVVSGFFVAIVAGVQLFVGGLSGDIGNASQGAYGVFTAAGALWMGFHLLDKK